MKKKIFLLIFLFILLVYSSSAFALNIDPLRQEFRVPVGGSQEGSYYVYNETNKDLHIKISARNWFVLEENKDIKLDSWLEFEPDELILSPGEKRELKFKAKIPDEAKGELSAMISFAPQSEEGSMLNVIFSVSLYCIIEGTDVMSANIKEVIARRQKDQLQVAVAVENKGNIHLRPRGRVIIEKGKAKIAEINLRYGWPVYPNRNEAYFGYAKWPNLKKGKYKARAFVDYGKPDDILEKTINFEVNKRGEIITN